MGADISFGFMRPFLFGPLRREDMVMRFAGGYGARKPVQIEKREK